MIISKKSLEILITNKDVARTVNKYLEYAELIVLFQILKTTALSTYNRNSLNIIENPNSEHFNKYQVLDIEQDLSFFNNKQNRIIDVNFLFFEHDIFNKVTTTFKHITTLTVKNFYTNNIVINLSNLPGLKGLSFKVYNSLNNIIDLENNSQLEYLSIVDVKVINIPILNNLDVLHIKRIYDETIENLIQNSVNITELILKDTLDRDNPINVDLTNLSKLKKLRLYMSRCILPRDNNIELMSTSIIHDSLISCNFGKIKHLHISECLLSSINMKNNDNIETINCVIRGRHPPYIGDINLFENCNNITDIVFDNILYPIISANKLYIDSDKLTTLRIPNFAIKNVFINTNNLNTLTIQRNVIVTCLFGGPFINIQTLIFTSSFIKNDKNAVTIFIKSLRVKYLIIFLQSENDKHTFVGKLLNLINREKLVYIEFLYIEPDSVTNIKYFLETKELFLGDIKVDNVNEVNLGNNIINNIINNLSSTMN